MLENLYRYFVVTAFQDKAQNKQGAERYTTAQEHFAGVLGIDPAKGKMLKRDFAFFESSQDKLAADQKDMDDEKAGVKREVSKLAT